MKWQSGQPESNGSILPLRTTEARDTESPVATSDQAGLSAQIAGRIGPSTQPQTLLYTAPSAWNNPGGGEVQLLRTAEQLKAHGLDARPFEPWNDRLENVNCLHLFGTLPECLVMARLAKQHAVKIAFSPIAWYDPRVNWALEPSLVRKLKGVASWSARRIMPRIPSWRRELAQLADVVLPNSKLEANQMRRLFGVKPSKTVVVPNGVDPCFEFADPGLFSTEYGSRDYVLIPGRIEPRKNQLTILRALWGLGIPIVVLGAPHDDHYDYYEQCRDEADNGVTFVDRIHHDSPLLSSAYAASRVVLMAGWFETPGLAALEGGLAGKHVIATDRGSASEYFGSHATYVNPRDAQGIREAVRSTWRSPASTQLQDHIRSSYLWKHVAEKTLRAYRSAGLKLPLTEQESIPLAA